MSPLPTTVSARPCRVPGLLTSLGSNEVFLPPSSPHTGRGRSGGGGAAGAGVKGVLGESHSKMLLPPSPRQGGMSEG